MTKRDRPQGAPATLSDGDAGLQSFMQHVYNTMAFGLVITGSTAFLVSHMPALAEFFYGFPMFIITLLAPLGFAFFGFTPARAAEMEVAKVSFIFTAYSAVMGLSISCLFWFMARDSVALMFFVTAATYMATGYYGQALKRNLGDLTSFLVMAAIGSVFTLAVYTLMHASMMHYIFSVVCVLVFTGITAWETHILKEAYIQGRGLKGARQRLGIAGALTLYLTFIGLFQSLLGMTFLNRNQRR